MINSYKEYLNLLKEGLITTHRISKYRIIIDNFLIDYKYNIKINDNDTFSLELYEKDIDFYISLLSLINNLGYYPSYIWVSREKKNSFKYDFDVMKKEIKNEKFKNIKLLLEAKFDIEIENIPKQIYHIFMMKYENKIFKNGLIPKSRMRKTYHPDRCYFTYSKIESENLINEFKFIDKVNNIDEKYDILIVNTSEIDDIKFYNDPNSVGFYTYDNISPEYLEKI